MKHQLLAFGLAASIIGSISLPANAIPVNGGEATSTTGKLITVNFDEADTLSVASGVAFDNGDATEIKPDFRVKIYIDNQLVSTLDAPVNQEVHRFVQPASKRSNASEVPIKIELFDVDGSDLEAIDIEPLDNDKVVDLIYKPATGEVFTNNNIKLGKSGSNIGREGLGDGEKKAIARLIINHSN